MHKINLSATCSWKIEVDIKGMGRDITPTPSAAVIDNLSDSLAHCYH